MLEGVVVIANILVRIGRIDEEIPVVGKDIGGRDVGFGQVSQFGFGDGKHLLGVKVEVTTRFVPQVRRGFAITHYLHGIIDPHRTVV